MVIYELIDFHQRCCDFEIPDLSILILRCITNNLSHLIIKALGFFKNNLPFIFATFINGSV